MGRRRCVRSKQRGMGCSLLLLATTAACSNNPSADDDQAAAASGQRLNGIEIFPGAGEGDGGEPLVDGMLCDYVSLADDGHGKAHEHSPLVCFYGPNDDKVPAATMEQVLECVEEQDVIHLRLTFNPDFVDNTYGSGSIGWPVRRGHRFSDLVKSDHAELQVRDGDDNVVMQFKLDYISEDPAAPSGYASLGAQKKDGRMIVGDAAWLVDYSTSLDRNLNERGYGAYLTDSPATDEDFSPNDDAPDWDYRVVYEAWIDTAALDGAAFGGASIEFVHASPSKDDDDTIEVTPGECPPIECGEVPDDECDPRTPPPTAPPEDKCVDAPDDECDPGPPTPTEPPTRECEDDLDVDCVPGEVPMGDPPTACDPEVDPFCDLG